MRIISGKYKSRRVYSAYGHDLKDTKGRKDKHPKDIKDELNGFRPTTDRAKETLFNVLNNILDFEDVTCLDLFAGSGSLGFEALSRGAASCEFVESYSKQAGMIKQTAEELGCAEQIKIHNEDAMRFLKLREGEGFDLVFADPPYAYENYTELVNEVMRLKFGIFALEHAAGEEPNLMYNTNDYDITEKVIGAVAFKIFVSKV